ncbi:MAG: hypothetical protein ACOC9R_04135 [bacterium]
MNRHDTDVTSLVFGLLFVGISVMWSLVQYDVLAVPGLEIAVPVLLVSVGLAGLLASVSRIRRDRDQSR